MVGERGASLRLAGATTAPTDVNASLAATADVGGDQYVFWKGQDGNLWYAVYTESDTTWSAAAVVAGMGPLGSEPTVTLSQEVLLVGPDAPAGRASEAKRNPALVGPSYLWVMWKGADGNLWSVEGTIATPGIAPASISWPTSPTVIPGMGPLGSGPTATAVRGVESNDLWVFWKGTDGNLWSVEGTPGSSAGTIVWPSTPTVVPGVGPLGSAPTAGADIEGDIYVYWEGSGNNTHLWEAWYDAAADSPAWSSAPIDLGSYSGNMGSAPSVAVSLVGQQYIFWQGQDGNLWYAEWTGEILGGPSVQEGVVDLPSESGGWLNNGFNYVGMGPLNSQPAATVSSFSDTLDVFWKGTNLNIWMASTPTGSVSWTGPTSVGDGPLDGQ